MSDMVRSEIDEPVEVTIEVNKEFINTLYKFMLLNEKAIRDVKEHFMFKLHYQSKDVTFDPDMIKVFINQHRK